MIETPNADDERAEYVERRIQNALRRKAHGEIRNQVDEIQREDRGRSRAALVAIAWTLGIVALLVLAGVWFYR